MKYLIPPLYLLFLIYGCIYYPLINNAEMEDNKIKAKPKNYNVLMLQKTFPFSTLLSVIHNSFKKICENPESIQNKLTILNFIKYFPSSINSFKNRYVDLSNNLPLYKEEVDKLINDSMQQIREETKQKRIKAYTDKEGVSSRTRSQTRRMKFDNTINKTRKNIDDSSVQEGGYPNYPYNQTQNYPYNQRTNNPYNQRPNYPYNQQNPFTPYYSQTNPNPFYSSGVPYNYNSQLSQLAQREEPKSAVSYYITVDLELRPGKEPLTSKDLSDMKCRTRWNEVSKAYAKYTGKAYIPPPVYQKPPPKQNPSETRKNKPVNKNNKTRKNE